MSDAVQVEQNEPVAASGQQPPAALAANEYRWKPGAERPADNELFAFRTALAQTMQEEDAKQCAADGDKTGDAADPEIFTESGSRRQAVLAPGASLDSRHNERRNCGETQQRTFEQGQSQRRGAGNLHANLSLPMRKNLQANEESKNHAAYERQKNQYAPARADAIRAAKNRARLRRWGSSCG